MTKWDYKAVAWFLMGAIMGCGFSHVVTRLAGVV